MDIPALLGRVRHPGAPVDGCWDRDRPLPGWTVHELVAHLVDEERWGRHRRGGGATVGEVAVAMTPRLPA